MQYNNTLIILEQYPSYYMHFQFLPTTILIELILAYSRNMQTHTEIHKFLNTVANETASRERIRWNRDEYLTLYTAHIY